MLELTGASKLDFFFSEWDYNFHLGLKEFILPAVLAVAGL